MRTRVKFCGLVRPEDVDAAVAIGVDAVGFVFYPRSARYLSFEAAAGLRRRLPSWVRAVGLFVNAERAWLMQGVREAGLDVVQAHGDELATELADLPVPCWKALRIGGPRPTEDGHARHEHLAQGRVPADPGLVRQALAGFDPVVEACLVDSASQGFGGSGHAFDWSVLPRPAPLPIVLAGGLTAGTVGQAIADVRPVAVDVSSGIQADDARRKDVIKMEGFMAAVLEADARHARTRAADIERGRG
ncbi:MAG: phosphoribosylanthranilate isomerase [Lautropia sp.]|nr:phosphoribosylanthranilate isomerase [Lautropia sp.]